MSSIFAKFKFERPVVPEEAVKPCLLSLCDGSGLVEKPCQYGYHFVKCLCRDL